MSMQVWGRGCFQDVIKSLEGLQRQQRPPASARLREYSLFSLCNLLDTVGLGLSGAAHGGDEFLVCSQDLLCLHSNLLLALHYLDLYLFLPDLLLLSGPLKLIGQLGFGCLMQEWV